MKLWHAAALALLVAFLSRSTYYGAVVFSDESVYSYMGNAWLHGMQPYRDAADLKPPGIFVAFAVFVSIFGYSMTALAVVLSLITIATAAVVFLIGRELWGEREGVLASVVFALFTGLNVFLLGSTETPLIFLTSAGFFSLIIAERRHTPLLLLISGLLFGAASQFKQSPLLELVIIGAALPLLSPARKNVDSLAKPLLLFAGTVVAWLPFFMYFTASGAFSEFIYWVFLYPSSYTGTQHGLFGSIATPFISFFTILLICPFICVATFAAPFYSRVLLTPTHRMLGVWAIAAFAGTMFGLQYYHYYLELAPPLALLAAGAIVSAFDATRDNVRDRGLVKHRVFIAVLVALLAINLLGELGFYASLYKLTRENPPGLHTKMPFSLANYSQDVLRAAEAVRMKTNDSDRILVFAPMADASIYLYSGRYAPAEQFNYMPLKLPRMLQIIRENKPTLVVLDTRFDSELSEQVRSELKLAYKLNETSGSYELYCRVGNISARS